MITWLSYAFRNAVNLSKKRLFYALLQEVLRKRACLQPLFSGRLVSFFRKLPNDSAAH